MARLKNIPARPSAISLDWLNAALVDSIDGTIRGFDIEILGEGEGFTGVIARVRLSYGPGGDGPASVIVKLPTEGENRAAVEAVGAYERELRVYTELADRIPLVMPDCLHADFDERPGSDRVPGILRWLDRRPPWLMRLAVRLLQWLGSTSRRNYVLVLEDMDPALPGDQVEGCDVDTARSVLLEVACLHAAFWGADENDEKSWLFSGDVGTNLLHLVIGDSIHAFRRECGDDLDPHALELLDHYATEGPALTRRLHRSPLTLSQGDLRLDNIFFRPDGSIRAFADWQGVTLSPAAWDVAYFLSGSVDRGVADREIDGLLADYHEALVAEGVTDYRMDDLERDFDLSMLMMLGRISATEQLDFGDGRGKELVAGWIRRIVAHVATVEVPEPA